MTVDEVEKKTFHCHILWETRKRRTTVLEGKVFFNCKSTFPRRRIIGFRHDSS